jgi:hypothetical protein
MELVMSSISQPQPKTERITAVAAPENLTRYLALAQHDRQRDVSPGSGDSFKKERPGNSVSYAFWAGIGAETPGSS